MNRAAARTGISPTSVIAACPNSDVKPLYSRAHGTLARFTPCSGQSVRGGTRAVIRQWCWKKLRCRQANSLKSCALHDRPHSGQGNSAPAQPHAPSPAESQGHAAVCSCRAVDQSAAMAASRQGQGPTHPAHPSPIPPYPFMTTEVNRLRLMRHLGFHLSRRRANLLQWCLANWTLLPIGE